jgi:hypothetical protein
MTLRRWTYAVATLAMTAATGAFAASGDSSEAGITFEKRVVLTPEETVAQSRDYMKKMLAVQARVNALDNKAKKDRDMVKLNCVSDKRTQVTGHMTVANQTTGSIEQAIQQNDNGKRQHEFTRLTILFQKVTTLGTEAEQCIGEDVSYVGNTTVQVDIDPSIPVIDPTEPDLPLPDVQRPPEASPFV